MKIGFFTVFRRDPQHYVLAELLIRSVRRAMPGVDVVQFTDETSPAVLGVDEVRRKPNGPMLELRLQHYAEVEGEWLLVDTDVLVQRDVRSVFAESAFDVAISDRRWPHLASESEGMEAVAMPYNTGVVFSRSTAFWREVLARWQALPPDERDWLSEQRVVASVIGDRKFRALVLPGAVYNFPPDAKNPGTDAAVLHFKGPRKALMIEAWKRTEGQAPGPEPEPQRLQPSRLARTPQPAAAGPLAVFIGYDERQPIAFHVAAHSVMARASRPVAITPLCLSQLPIRRRGLTEFTYSRFLVPWLCAYQGHAVFMDSDVLCRGDVVELFASAFLERVHAGREASVWVVKHRHRFEWPSVMVFDNERCQKLTPASVDDLTTDPFGFEWAERVGELPQAWNHLVGYDVPNPDAKLVHFTQGVPVWAETEACEFAAEWRLALDQIVRTCSFKALMGSSVHVKHMEAAAR